jgi:ornithine cyclodeaminase/alanine dehydrogenase
MLTVSDEEARRAFSWADAIDAIRATYLESAATGAAGRVTVASDGASIRAMVGVPAGPFIGSKQIVRAPGGLRYLITLFDREDASLRYLVDGVHLPAVRTAATSALALGELAATVDVLGLLGSGEEARHHLEAICALRSPQEIRVFSPRGQSRRAFVSWAAEHLGKTVVAAESPRDAVAGADVVVAAARSTGEQPILYAEWLAHARVVISIGSTLPHQRELDVSVLAAARAVVSDEPTELQHETGDLIAATEAGIDVSGRISSLAELLRGEPLLAAGAGFALYKSIGSALQDVAVARAVVARLGAGGQVVNFALEAR